MQIRDFITPDRVAYRLHAASKKRALELVSGLLAGGDASLAETEVFDCLVARERLGSTGLGHGIALPHGRIKGLKRIMGGFVRLDQGVDFDAIDGERVDLVCGLVVPAEASEEHLQVLASLAALFSETEMRDRLRRAESAAQLYDLLISHDAAPVKQTAAPRR